MWKYLFSGCWASKKILGVPNLNIKGYLFLLVNMASHYQVCKVYTSGVKLSQRPSPHHLCGAPNQQVSTRPITPSQAPDTYRGPDWPILYLSSGCNPTLKYQLLLASQQNGTGRPRNQNEDQVKTEATVLGTRGAVTARGLRHRVQTWRSPPITPQARTATGLYITEWLYLKG